MLIPSRLGETQITPCGLCRGLQKGQLRAGVERTTGGRQGPGLAGASMGGRGRSSGLMDSGLPG